MIALDFYIIYLTLKSLDDCSESILNFLVFDIHFIEKNMIAIYFNFMLDL